MTDSQLKQDLVAVLSEDFAVGLAVEVKKLCDALESLCSAVSSHIAKQRIANLKQRAVNEALLTWTLNWTEENDYVPDQVIEALREATKQ